MCCYKIMKQRLFERPVLRVHIRVFSIYIANILKFMYIFVVKFHTFVFIFKKYTTSMHFISPYVIKKYDSCTLTVCIPDWLLVSEMKHDYDYCDISLWQPSWKLRVLVAMWRECALPLRIQGYCGWMKCAREAVCSSEGGLKYCYPVQTMKSSLKGSYHGKHCCNSSGLCCEGLYNCSVVFSTSP
jgi:hypothetical protein